MTIFYVVFSGIFINLCVNFTISVVDALKGEKSELGSSSVVSNF